MVPKLFRTPQECDEASNRKWYIDYWKEGGCVVCGKSARPLDYAYAHGECWDTLFFDTKTKVVNLLKGL